MSVVSLTDKSRVIRKCSSEDYTFFLPLALSCKDIRWWLLFRSPLNNGSSYHRNQVWQYLHWSHSCPSRLKELQYDVWSKCISSILSAYSVWEFVDGTLMYAVFPVGANLADHQQKWKLLDKHILGLMASTIDDSLLSHVVNNWADPATFPSISKALWNKLFLALLALQLSFVFSNKSHPNTFASSMPNPTSMISCLSLTRWPKLG